MARRPKECGCQLREEVRWSDVCRLISGPPPRDDDLSLAILLGDAGLCSEQDGIETPELARAAWERFRLLEGLFAEWAEESADLGEEEVASRLAARLVELVLEWTKADGPWYAGLRTALVWALEAGGLETYHARFLAAEATAGRFKSWVAPTRRTIARVGAELAAAISEPEPGPPSEDALERWLLQRKELRAEPPTSTTPLPLDGHLRFIEEEDRARGDSRAERMRDALQMARHDALYSKRLSFAVLQRWQGVALGRSADLRITDAFAKGGQERYGTPSDLRARFDACLSEATEPGLPVALRAARAYLDVCFFHPFEDGNARAARLALDSLLFREGLGLLEAGPVFLVARRAKDIESAERLVRLVAALSGTLPAPTRSLVGELHARRCGFSSRGEFNDSYGLWFEQHIPDLAEWLDPSVAMLEAIDPAESHQDFDLTDPGGCFWKSLTSKPSWAGVAHVRDHDELWTRFRRAAHGVSAPVRELRSFLRRWGDRIPALDRPLRVEPRLSWPSRTVSSGETLPPTPTEEDPERWLRSTRALLRSWPAPFVLVLRGASLRSDWASELPRVLKRLLNGDLPRCIGLELLDTGVDATVLDGWLRGRNAERVESLVLRGVADGDRLWSSLGRTRLRTLVVGEGFRRVAADLVPTLRHLEIRCESPEDVKVGALDSLVFHVGGESNSSLDESIASIASMAPMRTLHLCFGGAATYYLDPASRLVEAVARLDVEEWGLCEVPRLIDSKGDDRFFETLGSMPRWPSLQRAWLPQSALLDAGQEASWCGWLGPVPWIDPDCRRLPSGRWSWLTGFPVDDET